VEHHCPFTSPVCRAETKKACSDQVDWRFKNEVHLVLNVLESQPVFDCKQGAHFDNGSAAALSNVLDFCDERFGVAFHRTGRQDLIASLRRL
jgi:hypothetical protein